MLVMITNSVEVFVNLDKFLVMKTILVLKDVSESQRTFVHVKMLINQLYVIQLFKQFGNYSCFWKWKFYVTSCFVSLVIFISSKQWSLGEAMSLYNVTINRIHAHQKYIWKNYDVYGGALYWITSWDLCAYLCPGIYSFEFYDVEPHFRQFCMLHPSKSFCTKICTKIKLHLLQVT